jgi:hypothetical protein
MALVKETARPASPERIVRASMLLCLGGATLEALGLLGWASGVSALTTIIPGLPPMMPRTAVALLLIGGAGALLQRDDQRRWWNTLSLLATVAVLALGVSQLAEYALGSIRPSIESSRASSQHCRWGGRRR